MDAYERVLGDAMIGDTTLFAREDYVEEAWRIVDPVLTQGTPLFQYAPGTWGPPEVNSAVVPHGGWGDPDTGITEVLSTARYQIGLRYPCARSANARLYSIGDSAAVSPNLRVNVL